MIVFGRCSIYFNFRIFIVNTCANCRSHFFVGRKNRYGMQSDKICRKCRILRYRDCSRIVCITVVPSNKAETIVCRSRNLYFRFIIVCATFTDSTHFSIGRLNGNRMLVDGKFGGVGRIFCDCYCTRIVGTSVVPLYKVVVFGRCGGNLYFRIFIVNTCSSCRSNFFIGRKNRYGMQSDKICRKCRILRYRDCAWVVNVAVIPSGKAVAVGCCSRNLYF